jgi:hypothetical protein
VSSLLADEAVDRRLGLLEDVVDEDVVVVAELIAATDATVLGILHVIAQKNMNAAITAINLATSRKIAPVSRIPPATRAENPDMCSVIAQRLAEHATLVVRRDILHGTALTVLLTTESATTVERWDTFHTIVPRVVLMMVMTMVVTDVARKIT